jgi:hypothetical protein
MFRGGFISLASCLICAGWCFAQQQAVPVAYFQPFLGQGVYDLTSVYSNDFAAWAEQRRANLEMTLTVLRLNREFAASPQYKAAMLEVEAAHDALDEARKPVLAAVAGDERHMELAEKYANVSQVLSEGGLPLNDLLDLAARKMEYGSQMHTMEGDALANDPAVKSARDRLVTAQRKLDDMREQFAAAMYKNPQWAAAKQAFDNSEISLASAEGAVVGANLTACLAVWADQRHQLYNFSYGNFYAQPLFVDSSLYYGRRY